jgi:hypothetical protein
VAKDKYTNLSGKRVTINTDPEISPIRTEAQRLQASRDENKRLKETGGVEEPKPTAVKGYKSGGIVTRQKTKITGKAC